MTLASGLAKLFAIIVSPAVGEPTEEIKKLPPCDYKVAPDILKLEKDKGGALAPDAALRLFDWLSDMDDIGFHSKDGCYARTHIMCRRLMTAGMEPQKAWAVPLEDDALFIHFPDGRRIDWGFHVAPALLVRQPNGNSEYMVFDRSLFDGPVSVESWAVCMYTPLSNVSLRRFGGAPKWYGGDYKPEVRTNSMTDEDAAETMRLEVHFQKGKPEVFRSPFRTQVMSLKAQELAMSFQRPM